MPPSRDHSWWRCQYWCHYQIRTNQMLETNWIRRLCLGKRLCQSNWKPTYFHRCRWCRSQKPSGRPSVEEICATCFKDTLGSALCTVKIHRTHPICSHYLLVPQYYKNSVTSISPKQWKLYYVAWKLLEMPHDWRNIMLGLWPSTLTNSCWKTGTVLSHNSDLANSVDHFATPQYGSLLPRSTGRLKKAATNI